MKSLKSRLILTISIVMGVCLLAVTVAMFLVSAGQLKGISTDSYRMSTENTTNELRAWMTEQEELVVMQGMSLELMQNFDYDYLVEYLTKIVSDYNENGYIYDLYFTTTENVMSSGCGYVPDGTIDFTQRGWFLAALETDGVAFSSPYRDTDSGKLVITISKKILSDGEVVGVLAADIFVDTLIAIIEEQEMPEDSYCFLVDADGNVVNHPDDTLFAYIDDEPINLNDCGNEDYVELGNTLMEEENNISFRDYDGVARTFYCNQMEGCNWYVVSAVSDAVLSSSTNSLAMLSVILVVISVVVMIVVVSILAGNIAKPIRDLTHRIQNGSEAGKAKAANSQELAQLNFEFDIMMGNIRKLLKICEKAELDLEGFGQSIQQLTVDIMEGSASVDSQMNRIVDSLNREHQEMQQEKVDLEQFDENIDMFKDQFVVMDDSIHSMVNKLNESVEIAVDLEKSTNTTNEHLKEIVEDINALSDMSNKITEIVETISAISTQTNLLALNASIEAARAGEAGRGFAVVAEEIRVLSGSTADATDGISAQIAEIQRLIDQSVRVLTASSEDFAKNTQNSQAVIQLLSTVNESAENVNAVSVNLKSSLSRFVESKDSINEMFNRVGENIQTCLEASMEAQRISAQQSQRASYMQSTNGELNRLSEDFKQNTANFKGN